MWWFIAGTSLFLIGLGTWLILRDDSTPSSSHTGASVEAQNITAPAGELPGDAKGSTWGRLLGWRRTQKAEEGREAERIPRSTCTALVPVPRPASPQGGVHALMDVVTGVLAESGELTQPMQRDAAIEQRWRQVAPQIELAIVPLNELLTAVQIVVSPHGEQGWSPSNSGFGVYRRLIYKGQSIAWLRTEAQHDGGVIFKVRAQSRDLAMINRSLKSQRWPLTEAMAANDLATVLIPVAEYAAWLEVEPQTALEKIRQATAERAVQHAGQADTRPAPQPPPAARMAKTVRLSTRDDDRGTLVNKAIGIVNGAFADVGARLEPRTQGGAADMHPSHAYQILVHSTSAGLVVIVERPTEIEVSVGVADPVQIDLAKRQVLRLPQTTAYELAEAVANCVWPSIAAVSTPGHITH